VARGIDMFDCVMPTRAGRHGLAFTRSARSICAMPGTRKIRARSTRSRPARRAAIIRAPICTIWSQETLVDAFERSADGGMLLISAWNNSGARLLPEL
jgi:tRNA-guanine family transglycosylase